MSPGQGSRFNQTNTTPALHNQQVSTTRPTYYTDVTTDRNSDTSRFPRSVNRQSESVATYDPNYISSEQSQWLYKAHSEMPLRTPDYHHSKDFSHSPSNIATHQQMSPHVTDSRAQVDHRSDDRDRSSGATGVSNNRSVGSPITTGLWAHSSHDSTSNNMSDLFPLLYANRLLSSYHNDSHSDFYSSRK